MTGSKRTLAIPGGRRGDLIATLDLPTANPIAVALYAHCFTCSKDSFAAARIGTALASAGWAMLRFDFSSLMLSENIADLKVASDYLTSQLQAPSLLIGHSLGGVAAVFAAPHCPAVKGVALLNCPPRADHLLKHFGDYLEQIASQGEAMVPVYEKQKPRRFLIQQEFVDDLKRHDLAMALAQMAKPLLVLYSQADDLMSEAEARQIFEGAKFSKQWSLLPGADHILTERQHGLMAGQFILDWWASLA